MSAGTGIRHSEMNNNVDLYAIDPLHDEFDIILPRILNANYANAITRCVNMEMNLTPCYVLAQVAFLTNLDQA